MAPDRETHETPRDTYQDSMVRLAVDVEFLVREIADMRNTDNNREENGREPFFGEREIARRTLEIVDGWRDDFTAYETARADYFGYIREGGSND